MLIDLHCHTKSTCKGDGIKRDVSPERFVEAVSNAGVDIVAITNHNCFDLEQFSNLKKAADGLFMVWPGVEMDVCLSDDTGHWHMLVIANPKEAETFSEKVRFLISSKPEEQRYWHFDDIRDSFADMDTFFVSHCHDKRPFISEEELEKVLANAGRDWGIYFEPRTLVTVGIWSNHGRNMLLGSDVQDWDSYPGRELPSLRLPVDSFEQLVLLAKRDQTIIKTLLGDATRSEIDVSPCDGVYFKMPIYKEMNVIFGQKGTGKSEIINSLEKHFEQIDSVRSVYRGGAKIDAFKNLLATPLGSGDPSSFGRSDCQDEIEYVTEWSDTAPTQIGSFIKWVSTKGNSSKKERFKISESQALPGNSPAAYQQHLKAASEIRAFITKAKEKHFTEYLDVVDAQTLIALLEKAMDSALKSAQECFIEYKSIEMANAAIESIKASIDSKSNTVSKPSKTGFHDYVVNRLCLYQNADAIIRNLEPKSNTEYDYLGRLEDKGQLLIATTFSYLTTGSKTDEFNAKISDLRKWKETIARIRNSALSASSLSEEIASISSKTHEAGLSSLEAFIGVRRFIVLENSKKEYSPSDGEKGVLLLERKLNEQADVYLLDEPELGMSNSYIDAVIRPKLQRLAASGKTVIVATHNANIAVRTLPYLCLYREHVSGDLYRSFFGNPFCNELVCDEDGVPPKSWSNCSMETLEGGEEAFYDRMTIYEAGR